MKSALWMTKLISISYYTVKTIFKKKKTNQQENSNMALCLEYVLIQQTITLLLCYSVVVVAKVH